MQTSIAGQVNLVNTAGLTLELLGRRRRAEEQRLVDGGDGTWQNSAGNDNWTEATALSTRPSATAPSRFSPARAGTVTVDDSLGAVTVAGMQFATDGYVVEGDPIALAGVPGHYRPRRRRHRGRRRR